MTYVHAEIEYIGEEIPIHSDICPPKCSFENIDDEYRKFLHASLDEWLDKSNGTGAFYIKNDTFKLDPIHDVRDT